MGIGITKRCDEDAQGPKGTIVQVGIREGVQELLVFDIV